MDLTFELFESTWLSSINQKIASDDGKHDCKSIHTNAPSGTRPLVSIGVSGIDVDGNEG